MSDVNLDKRFSEILVSSRRACGFTQAEIAESMSLFGCKWTQVTVYKIETGKRNITLSEGIWLARLMKTTVDELFESAPNFDVLPQNLWAQVILRTPESAELLVTLFEGGWRDPNGRYFPAKYVVDAYVRTVSEGVGQ